MLVNIKNNFCTTWEAIGVSWVMECIKGIVSTCLYLSSI